MQLKHIKNTKCSESPEYKKICGYIKKYFGANAEPFALHSIDYELFAGFWVLFYETVLAEGKVVRANKEALAVSTSLLNECPFCVDAHSIMLFKKNKQLLDLVYKVKDQKIIAKSPEEKLIEWTLHHTLVNTPETGAETPFNSEQKDEIIGTLVIFHYINRMVTLFAKETPLPSRRFKKLMMAVASNFIFARALKRKKAKGEALRLITFGKNKEGAFQEIKDKDIRLAFSSFKGLLDKKTQHLLPEGLKNLLNEYAQKQELLSVTKTMHNKHLNEFIKSAKENEKELARFCFQVMFEPYKITGKQIISLKQIYSDHEILQLAGFSAFAIANSIGKKLNKKNENT